MEQLGAELLHFCLSFWQGCQAVVKIMRFILKGSQISALQLKGWFKSETPIQEYRNEIQNSYEKLCMNYMVHVLSTMEEIRINHLTLLLVVTMHALVDTCDEHIILRTSSDVFIFNLGLRFEGLF